MTFHHEIVGNVFEFFRVISGALAETIRTAEGWSALGTWAGVVVAAAVGIYARLAWRTAQKQLAHAETEFKGNEDQKRNDLIQRSTSELISELYTLIPHDRQPTSSYGLIAQNVFQQSMLFLMSVPNDFDRTRYSALVRALNGAGRARNKRVNSPEIYPIELSSFGFRIVEAYVAALVEFGKRHGDYDLLAAWESALRDTFAKQKFNDKEEIRNVMEDFDQRLNGN